ncbi:Glycosidase [Lysinibacillus sp. TC-37]|uniref:Alpha-amlyase n=1 Tax=Lysinibacillus fusiformis TaxID=28031 RepID=A0A2I0V6E9_9BACI|nr:alpha-amlyase [Lysinibacillus sp. F5]PKU53889.1 alpha-amlyase [Lysinibacillus fusiformis]SCZ09952.1 Glycosidase [Lysinibacillus sp. SG9]SDB54736.1 Glycosidase [Lysinibacillus sp. TC-37]SFT19013.1 Glycosidase [Lysinibacillus sp. SG55]
MKFKKWISATAASLLLATSFVSTTPVAHADEKATTSIAEESIFDLLVDRFFNGSGTNDFDTNTKDPSKFAGGDFTGLQDKLKFIGEMGFTIVSIGPIFSTEKYDGSLLTSYTTIERHFGTTEEFQSVVEAYKAKNMSIMVDFPLNNVSPNHEWAKDSSKADWIASTNNGQVQWDLSNKAVQEALIQSATEFVSTYDVGGIRLTNIAEADIAFVNAMIAALKETKASLYVIANEESDADFDATFSPATADIYRNIFKNVDMDSSKLMEPFTGEKPTQIMVDSLETHRFTFDSATENMFPPTRLKMAMGALFMLPGIPVVQYGTEIAMNGEAKPDTHQLYNFKTDEELIDYIKNVQSLRNQSATLRKGDFEVITNDNGLLVFTRTSDEEKWVIMVNNTGKTQRVDLTPAQLGEGKMLNGILHEEKVRINEKEVYPVILDREMVEIYQVRNDEGLNMPYMVALGLVWVIFIGFVVIIIKRGKVRRQEQDVQQP